MHSGHACHPSFFIYARPASTGYFDCISHRKGMEGGSSPLTAPRLAVAVFFVGVLLLLFLPHVLVLVLLLFFVVLIFYVVVGFGSGR